MIRNLYTIKNAWKNILSFRDSNPDLWRESPLLLPLHYSRNFKIFKKLEKSFNIIEAYFFSSSRMDKLGEIAKMIDFFKYSYVFWLWTKIDLEIVRDIILFWNFTGWTFIQKLDMQKLLYCVASSCFFRNIFHYDVFS